MNNYILEYYQSIKDGTVLTGKWVTLWYEKIVAGMQDGLFTYDHKKATKAIRFIESFCRHHEGRLAPQLLKLELWQKALLSVLFGIVDENGFRQFREAFIVISRKNGKTLLAAAIAAYMTFLDGEYGARVYFTATKIQQAALCYDAFYQMITKEAELSTLAKKRRTDIYIQSTNTSAMPLAFSAKRADGLNPSLCVCDEIAAWSGDAGLKQYEVLKSALGARTQPLLMSISTAGYVKDSIYDELMRRSTSVILGGSKETRLAPFLYIIDDPAKWDDINELRKSNPNLGVSVSADYLIEEIAVAEQSLSKRSEFLTKYCNVPANSSQAWLSYQDVDKACKEPFSLEDLRDCYAVGGIDLSQTTDLTSACVVVEKNGVLHVISHFWIPTERIDVASAEDSTPYEIFKKQGLLSLSGDNYVDYKDVFEWFRMIVEEYGILPLQVGYDRYSAQYLIDDMRKYGFRCDDVYQGFNLTPVIKEFEGILRDGKIQIGSNNLLKSHLLNTALKVNEDNAKVKIIKLGNKTRIDGTAALLDALTVRQKWYAEIGDQLRND